LLKLEQNSRRPSTDKNKELEALLRSHQTRIRVVGCGGGGNNTITRLMEVGVHGVETLAINTDAQDLLAVTADDKILIGQNMTKGLGAGSDPQIGEDSARENQQEIEEALQNSDLVFVTCGLGGGTGTGSAPIVAETAKNIGAVTISIVTLPFADEGVGRWENAQCGLEKLRRHSDTVIAIQNDRLLEIVPDLPLGMAFKVADEILVNAVKGITELITEKGLINLDFADVRAIMQNGGTAMIGIGESEDVEGAQAAVEMAMQNKLLEVDIAGAKNALINITGGAQMPLKDAKKVMKIVAEKLDPSAKIIWGARVDLHLDKAIRVMLIVTGLREKREAVAAREKNAIDGASAQSIIQLGEKLFKAPANAQENSTPIQNPALFASSAATAALMPAVSPTDSDAIVKRHPIPSKRSRKISSIKSPKPSEKFITDDQALKLIESSAPIVTRDDIIRVTFADGMAPPETVNHAVETVHEAKINDETPQSIRAGTAVTKAVATAEVKDVISSSKKTNIQTAKLEITTPSGDPNHVARQSAISPAPVANHDNSANAIDTDSGKLQSRKPDEPLLNQQNPDRWVNINDLPTRPIPPAANGVKFTVAGNMSNRPQPAVRNVAPPSNRASGYNKIFAEQSREHLQIIREAIGQLFTDPTRQETLRRIKHTAIAVNNLAKRFVFDVIAAYAASIEEICERVLDGEINMSKKLVNAFTEIPTIFDSMVHGDTDALVEAKRHQERLQRLADSFTDGEVVNLEMAKRSAPVNLSTQTTVAAPPPPRPSPAPLTKTAPPLERRPRPATEVMEYLDDLFAEGKKPSRP